MNIVKQSFKFSLVLSLVLFFVACEDNCPLPEMNNKANNTSPVAKFELEKSSKFYTTDTISLDASESYDINGDSLYYSWRVISQPENSLSAIVAHSDKQTSFIPDLEGMYIFSLRVKDFFNDSSVIIDSSFVYSKKNHAPTPIILTDSLTLFLSDTLILDGTRSFDEDGDSISFYWSIVEKPSNSLKKITDPSDSILQFVPDVTGFYYFNLTVTDTYSQTSVSEVIIQVKIGLETIDLLNKSLVFYDNFSNEEGWNLLPDPNFEEYDLFGILKFEEDKMRVEGPWLDGYSGIANKEISNLEDNNKPIVIKFYFSWFERGRMIGRQSPGMAEDDAPMRYHYCRNNGFRINIRGNSIEVKGHPSHIYEYDKLSYPVNLDNLHITLLFYPLTMSLIAFDQYENDISHIFQTSKNAMKDQIFITSESDYLAGYGTLTNSTMINYLKIFDVEEDNTINIGEIIN